jgi:acyl-coenzyme A thioesterase PaaI-like protein
VASDTLEALQRTYAAGSTCFGCGPANDRGLRIESRVDGDALVADWTPEPWHAAFDGVLNGGIIGTLLDCHANWAAAWHLMQRDGAERPPACVTADYAVRLLRPTSTERPLRLLARVVDASADRATVEAEIVSDGRTTATCRGTFVAVGPDHPAAGRW